jgi:MFS family permease
MPQYLVQGSCQANDAEAAEEDTRPTVSREVFRTSRFWVMTLAAAGAAIAVWAHASWLPSYLEDYRHSSQHTFQYYALAAYALAAYGLAAYGLGLVVMLAGLVPFAMGWLIDLDGDGYAFLMLFVLLGISAICAVRMHRLGY